MIHKHHKDILENHTWIKFIASSESEFFLKSKQTKKHTENHSVTQLHTVQKD